MEFNFSQYIGYDKLKNWLAYTRLKLIINTVKAYLSSLDKIILKSSFKKMKKKLRNWQKRLIISLIYFKNLIMKWSFLQIKYIIDFNRRSQDLRIRTRQKSVKLCLWITKIRILKLCILLDSLLTMESHSLKKNANIELNKPLTTFKSSKSLILLLILTV